MYAIQDGDYMSKIVYTTSDALEATMVIGYLKDSNIDAKMENEMLNNILPNNNGGITNINIIVEDLFYDKSLLLIKEIESMNTKSTKTESKTNNRKVIKYIVIVLIMSSYAIYLNKQSIVHYIKNALSNDKIYYYKWNSKESCAEAYFKDTNKLAEQCFDINNNNIYEKIISYNKYGQKLSESYDSNENSVIENIIVYDINGSPVYAEHYNDDNGFLESREEYTGNGTVKTTRYKSGILIP
jgi:hypothetical protein